MGKAIHLIGPAFADSLSLKNRLESIAVALVDGATLPASASGTALARELLALSSILAMARTAGLLSPMNADLLAREAQQLLQEVAGYEEPRLELDDSPTLASLTKTLSTPIRDVPSSSPVPRTQSFKGHTVKDNKGHSSDRREAILSILKNKGSARIKDMSLVIRGVSEKTIQRELMTLIAEGIIRKEGERRWSTYFLA